MKIFGFKQVLVATILYICNNMLQVNAQFMHIVAPYAALNQDKYPLIPNQGNQVNFTIANFGYIPWGKRIIAPLDIADPIDACTTLKPLQLNEHGQLPLVLVERGNCKFTQKARNVQNAGGRLAIIFDNTVEPSQYITMGDDGTGDGIQIPSIFISEREGEDLIKIQNYSMNKDKDESDTRDKGLLLSVEFDIQEREIVEVGLFMNLPQESSLFFVNEFQKTYNQYLKGESVEIYPVYQYLQSYRQEYNTELPNCLGGGKYCCIDSDGDYGTVTGRQIAEEQLRQICVFDTLGIQTWFDFISAFIDKACPPQAYTSCHQDILKNKDYLGLKKDQIQSLQKCYDNSFENKNNHNLGENKILEKELLRIEYSGMVIWPGIHINNVTYNGKYTADAVEEAICSGMLEKSERCKRVMDPYLYPTEQDGGISTFGIIAIILVILVVLFGIILFTYKRYIMRDTQTQVRGQVNQMFANYIKFNEAKQKDTENN